MEAYSQTLAYMNELKMNEEYLLNGSHPSLETNNKIQAKCQSINDI